MQRTLSFASFFVRDSVFFCHINARVGFLRSRKILSRGFCIAIQGLLGIFFLFTDILRSSPLGRTLQFVRVSCVGFLYAHIALRELRFNERLSRGVAVSVPPV